MMTIVSYLLFAITLATSVIVTFYTVAPALPRIIALLQGRADVAALPQLVLRDRRQMARSARPQTQPAQRAAA